ncbi:hypothetical protein [Klebsiella pneumoniae ISC21]|nr:hypothetical protein [Klebsiella pneumoniae ISC21]
MRLTWRHKRQTAAGSPRLRFFALAQPMITGWRKLLPAALAR